MIKVLFYIDEITGGGAEKVLCNLVNNMDPSCFDITVHTTWKSDAEKLLNPHIHYKYVYSSRSQLNRLVYRIETQIGLFYQLHLKGNYDIEVAYLECGPTKVMAASTNRKAAHIAWIHCDLEKKFSNMNSFAKKAKNQYKKYDRVICVSEECNKTYQKYFPECAPSQVLYNVIDAEEILSKASLKLDPSPGKKRLTAVAVGRLSQEKNYKMLLEVHRQLIENNVDYDLWIVGDGPEKPELEEFIKENHLQDSVKLWGYQSNPYPIMKEADFLVCSSKYEGYSTVVIEALTLGLPVVTTDCGGMRMILDEDKYGIVTDNSAGELKAGMEKLIIDDDLRRSYSVRATQRAKELTGRKAAKETEELFETVLHKKKISFEE